MICPSDRAPLTGQALDRDLAGQALDRDLAGR
jgi:hypothetical protein